MWCVSLWLFFISDALSWLLNPSLAVLGCSSLLRQVLSTLRECQRVSVLSAAEAAPPLLWGFHKWVHLLQIKSPVPWWYPQAFPWKQCLGEDWLCFNLIAQPLEARNQFQICPADTSELLT